MTILRNLIVNIAANGFPLAGNNWTKTVKAIAYLL